MIHMVQKWDNSGYEIVLLLVKEKKHLRKLAKELKIPHSTVMRKLNNLTKENIVDSKQEGKNKVFFIKKNLQARNYLQQAEQYKLSKLIKKYPKLSIILEDILKSSKEQMIVLFGSYAKFQANTDSDIDIYIETRNKKIKNDIKTVYSKINVKTGKFDMNSNLIKEIIENHVILKGVENFYEKTKFFE